MKPNFLLLSLFIISTVNSQNGTIYRTRVERSKETSINKHTSDNLLVEKCLQKNCTRVCEKRCGERQTAWFTTLNSSFECVNDKYVMYGKESKSLLL